MIIAIWLIGIMMIWMLTMLVFNLKGYWTVSSYISWCAVWTVLLAVFTLLTGGAGQNQIQHFFML